jgi:hypothetical protein
MEPFPNNVFFLWLYYSGLLAREKGHTDRQKGDLIIITSWL